MNLLISAAKLAAAARAAAHAVRADQGSRNLILNCVQLAAGTDLTIYGTDLNTDIETAVDCDVMEPGEAVVDAHKFSDIASKLKGDVRIEGKSDHLLIKNGRVRFTLTTRPLKDYPPPLVVDAERPPIDLSAADVMAIFNGAAAAAATNNKQIYLAGPIVFSEPTDFGHRLCAVGADNVMLSYATTTAASPDLGQGVLVHRNTCKLAVNLFGQGGGSLRLGARLIEIASDSTRMVAKLIDAVPSAWRSSVPPVDAANSVVVSTKDLIAVLERCFAVIDNLTDDAGKRVPSIMLWWDAAVKPELCVSFGHGAPTLRDVVPAVQLNGKTAIAVNPKLLLRLIEGLELNIRLSASEHSTPLRIDAGSDRFALLSPIRDFANAFEDAAA